MKNVLCGLLIVLGLAVNAHNDKYQFYLDLNKISSDLIQVKLTTPTISSDKIIYNMPKIVPGTYKIYDFGQYAMDFEAFNKDGKPLSVNKLDKNRWEIENATTLAEISYWVEDTWDANVDELVFEPGGTNIEKGENVVLNNHGFFGYFDGMKYAKYEVNVTRPDDFYGSTGLSTIKTTGNIDQFTTDNYMDLVDSPIMYNVPDTTTFKIGNADILISVYSKNKSATALELSKDIKEILELQKDYLGGTLPVDKYAFIIYLYAGASGSGGSGALEHSYSSFYYLPEMSAEQLSGFVVRVAAHEFFHIVTPLNIHSKEIGDFDFISPKMSKHLWMYEGVTEYFAGHVQVYGGMKTPKEYLELIEEKLVGAAFFKDELAFTELSLQCLGEHEDQYSNVYLKGAIIGMCLDILLRDQSGGKIGIKDMMAMLSKEYGKYKSFEDVELFDKIAELSSPEIREFFTKYVEAGNELPLADLLNRVGVTFKKDVKVKEVGLGGVSLDLNPETNRLYIADMSNMNEFGKALGYKINDEFVAINGVEINMDSVQEQMNNFKKNTKNGDKVEIIVARTQKGKTKNKKLKAKAITIEKNKKYLIELNENITKEQLELRNAWLGQE
ncbi:MAG: peptidase M61 [Flavobacteriales bacterium]|nr:MAG: peptidase M61 [Flavobacteriales bacterium]